MTQTPDPYGEPTPGASDPGAAQPSEPPAYPSYPDLTKRPDDAPTQPYAQQPYSPPAPAEQPFGQPGYQSSAEQPAWSPPPPPPYGQPAPQAYGQPGYGQGYPPYAMAPDHQQATTVLVLGILGLLLCQVLSPFAWVMGNRVVREIDASNGALGGRSSANAGRICGIIGTVLIGLAILFFGGFLVIAILAAAGSTSP